MHPLRRYLKDLGEPVRDFADRVGASRQTLYRIIACGQFSKKFCESIRIPPPSALDRGATLATELYYRTWLDRRDQSALPQDG